MRSNLPPPPQGENLGKGGIDLTPSEERSAPQAPEHFQFDAATNPESLHKGEAAAAASSSATEPSREAATGPKLLPRETGHDIGMGSPVPLSAEAVGIITRLRNMKVSALSCLWMRHHQVPHAHGT